MVVGPRARLLAPLVLASVSQPPIDQSLTLQSAAAYILRACDPRFLAAVRAEQAFLYRGEAITAAAAVLSPPPDLLAFETYGSIAALSYFQNLERELSDAKSYVCPSNGHIAVADADAAAQWGGACSIWPLGARMHYAYPKDRRDFYPLNRGESSAQRILGGASTIAVDTDIGSALRSGREVMFATEEQATSAAGRGAQGTSARGCAFLAVRASADTELNALLFGE